MKAKPKIEIVIEPELATNKNSKFIYKSGSDVMATWKKTGWIPPSLYRMDYLFRKENKC